MKIKVSVIVPIYNVEKYLRQCLDSIIHQTLKDIEIILIDEGDMDQCRKIIDEYEQKDERITTIHEFNGGYGVAVNKGIQRARGQYIGIVEADDFISSNMFFDLYSLADEFNADIVKSNFYYYSSTNNIKKADKITKNKSYKVICAKEEPFILRIQPSIWSAIYKKEFLVKNNIKFLETRGAAYQDTSFSFKTLSLAKKIVLTPNAYLYYRIDNQSSSVNSKSNPFAICNEYDEITDFLNKNPEIKSFANTNKLINQYFTYIWNIKRIKDEDKNLFLDRFFEEFSEYYRKGELTPPFVKKVGKKAIENLLRDKEAFGRYIFEIIRKNENLKKRRSLFSLRLNTSRIRLVLFGKELITKDF